MQTGQTGQKASEMHALTATRAGASPLADATGSRAGPAGPGGPSLRERLQRKLQDSKYVAIDKLDLALSADVPLHAPGTDDPHENAGKA